MTKRKKILLVFSCSVVAVILCYFLFHGLLIAYCSDAYLRANFAEITPRVNGHIKQVYVINNQNVKKGELLAELEPKPYHLKLNVEKATLKQQQAQLDILKAKMTMAKANLAAEKKQYLLMQEKVKRYKKLSKDGAVSVQQYQDIDSRFQDIRTKLSAAKEEYIYWEDSYGVQLTVIDASKAKVALAEYFLKQTKIHAPADGYVVNINVRPGDFATQGQPMFSILDNSEWWVIANYKEYLVSSLKPGQSVWITTDLYPLRRFKGTVVNTSKAVSRTAAKDKLIPYVSPTTDWVRLQRRFQVRIAFDEKLPEDVELRMGADARTFVWLW